MKKENVTQRNVTAIISPLVVNKDFYKYNWPMMMLASFALYYFLKNDEVLSATEGLILFSSFSGTSGISSSFFS